MRVSRILFKYLIFLLFINMSMIYISLFLFLFLVRNAPFTSLLMALITSVQLPIQSQFPGNLPECSYTDQTRIRHNLFPATALPTFPTSATYFRKHSAQFLLLNFRLESLPPGRLARRPVGGLSNFLTGRSGRGLE